jgi:lipoprotein-anchoring transpeptidase ErfK/SrfK
LAVLVAGAGGAAAQGFNPFGDIHTTRAAQEAARRSAVQAPGLTTALRAQRAGSSASGGFAVTIGPTGPIPQGPITRVPLLEGGARPSISPVAPSTVSFASSYSAGTIVIDTAGRRLYYVLSSTRAYRYPISVGREGFTWRGTESVSRKTAWPDWRPPAEMRERDPRLPDLMTGGINNPLGAMAIYLGNTLYRIHGTNDTTTIGQAASSGCFRMTNGHVMHLAGLVSIGAKVHVLDRLPANVAERAGSGKSG